VTKMPYGYYVRFGKNDQPYARFCFAARLRLSFNNSWLRQTLCEFDLDAT
jgi:hypothetical protein